jgi:beta-glucanase (GH16 family)
VHHANKSRVTPHSPIPVRTSGATPTTARPSASAPSAATTATPGITRTPATGPSGLRQPPAPRCADLAKADGTSWHCSFDEEFNGTALDPSRWIAQQTATSGYTSGLTACFVDSPDNIAVGGGVLSLTARREPAPFTCQDPHGAFTTSYTSGMVSTWGRFAQAYGRFEVRARVSAATAAGLQSSLWLYPSDPARYGAWPLSGEIDIAEMYSRYPDRAVPYIHYAPASPDPNVTNTACLITDLAAFHTYAVEWTPTSIRIAYDGTTCLVDTWHPAAPLTGAEPFDQPFMIVLTQALGIGANAFDPDTTPLPASTQVDYVRAWR